MVVDVCGQPGSDFKTVGRHAECRRWVRLPCALATSISSSDQEKSERERVAPTAAAGAIIVNCSQLCSQTLENALHRGAKQRIHGCGCLLMERGNEVAVGIQRERNGPMP
jgi:hypothetical protein